MFTISVFLIVLALASVSFFGTDADDLPQGGATENFLDRNGDSIAVKAATIGYGSSSQPMSILSCAVFSVDCSLDTLRRMIALSGEVYGYCVNHVTRGSKLTPLHFACKARKTTEVLEKIRLLLAAGADVNSRDEYGQTPLILAVKWQRLHRGNLSSRCHGHRNRDTEIYGAPTSEVVTLLIEAGADVRLDAYSSINRSKDALAYAEDRLRECRDRLPMCTEDEQKKARRQNIWDKNPGFEEFDIAAVAEAEKVVNIIWNVGSATF